MAREETSLPALNPLSDLLTARSLMEKGGEGDAPAAHVSAHNAQYEFKAAFDAVGGEPKGGFPNYHFVRDMDSLVVPVQTLRSIYQHTDLARLRLALRRVTHPWGDGGELVLAQIDDELTQSEPPAEAGVPWHHVLFRFDEYVCYFCMRSRPAGPGMASAHTPLQSLAAGIADGEVYRFVHRKDASSVFVFQILQEQQGKEVVTTAHRVL